jgi:putative tryptophan/tyrosine transport system substrate-binding protein
MELHHLAALTQAHNMKHLFRCVALVALKPEVILAHGTSTVTPLLQVTRTVPIVFVSTTDPVGAGLVNSFTRPGGNATGFMAFEYSLSAKWLELLKRIMPEVARVAVLRESSQGSGTLSHPLIF